MTRDTVSSFASSPSMVSSCLVLIFMGAKIGIPLSPFLMRLPISCQVLNPATRVAPGLELATGQGAGQLLGRGLGGAAAVGRHRVPVEGVVPHLGGVVEETAVGAEDHLLEGLALEGVAGEQLVRVVHVGLVVLAVVERHRPGADVGLEGVLGVGQCGQLEGHLRLPSVVSR